MASCDSELDAGTTFRTSLSVFFCGNIYKKNQVFITFRNKYLIQLLVARLELARANPADFESAVSTNFTIPAFLSNISRIVYSSAREY